MKIPNVITQQRPALLTSVPQSHCLDRSDSPKTSCTTPASRGTIKSQTAVAGAQRLPVLVLMMKLETNLVSTARDARGMVFEPLNAAELAAQRNVHVVITEAGHVRGNHYHRVTTEILAVLGPALVRVRAEDGLRDFMVAVGEIRRFVIPPGMPHAIRHDGSQAGVLVSFTTQPHDPSNPDTCPEVLIAPQAA
jgi:dTDP-4-dehydrorhamnose 3,5-epimerase-like enzyme